MTLTDQQTAEAVKLAEFMKGYSGALARERQLAEAVLALHADNQQLREALRQIADGERVTVPTSAPEPVWVDGREREAVYVKKLTAREIARAALGRDEDAE